MQEIMRLQYLSLSLSAIKDATKYGNDIGAARSSGRPLAVHGKKEKKNNSGNNTFDKEMDQQSNTK